MIVIKKVVKLFSEAANTLKCFHLRHDFYFNGSTHIFYKQNNEALKYPFDDITIK